jgi:hypothetical protein
MKKQLGGYDTILVQESAAAGHIQKKKIVHQKGRLSFVVFMQKAKF